MHMSCRIKMVANQSSESSFVLRHLNNGFNLLIAVLLHLLYGTFPDMHIVRLPKASDSGPRSLDGYFSKGH